MRDENAHAHVKIVERAETWTVENLFEDYEKLLQQLPIRVNKPSPPGVVSMPPACPLPFPVADP